MALGVDPKVDYAFKRVLGDARNADILIHLLNAIVKPPAPIVTVEILNPFNEQDFKEDKLTILDVKVRDIGGGRVTGPVRRAGFSESNEGVSDVDKRCAGA